MAGRIFIGTSGYSYPHWRGTFYPEGLKHKSEAAYYYQRFETLELNNPFYRLPERATFEAWKAASPPGFVFSVKANRFITHMKKLNDCAEPVARMMERYSGLGRKLGPILFQLPPSWHVNVDRLEEFLDLLPRRRRFVFEFRDPTWFTEPVYALLKKHRCSCCIFHLAGELSPITDDFPFIYVRLHGPGDKYQGSYTPASLAKWAKRCKQWSAQGKDVYVYFDNDQLGYAAFNALALKKLCDQ